MLLDRIPAISLTALALAVSACGTVQPFVPAQPLPKGKASGVFGASFSLNRIGTLALAARLNYGLSDRDLLGVGWSQPVFLLPSDLSYVRYDDIGERRWLSYQLHLHSLLGFGRMSVNPAVVAAVGLGGGGSDAEGSVSLGIGYAGLGLRDDSAASWTASLIPYAATTVRLFRGAASFTWQPGLAARYHRHFVATPRPGSDTIITIGREQIERIDSTVGEYGRWYSVTLRDSAVIVITTAPLQWREFVFVSIEDPTSIELDAYPASPRHRTYYVYRISDALKESLRFPRSHVMLHLDMDAIFRRYAETGVLELREEPGIWLAALTNGPSIWRDFTIGAGVYGRGR